MSGSYLTGEENADIKVRSLVVEVGSAAAKREHFAAEGVSADTNEGFPAAE